MQLKTGILTPGLFITLCIIILFLVLEPKISSRLIPIKSQQARRIFLTKTISQKSVNVRDFWQFREFYSPGSFRYNPAGITAPEILTSYVTSLHFTPILVFSSPRLQSAEGYTTLSSLSIKPVNADVLLSRPHTLLFRNRDNSYILMFITSVNDIKQANGYLQYETQAESKGKNWINVTRISR